MSFAVATATTDASAIITAALADAWTGDAAMIFWGNATSQATAQSTWLRARILHGRSAGATYSAGGANVKIGLLRILIFGPKNAGTGPLNLIADELIAAFERQLDSGVIFMGRFGEGIDGPFPADEAAWAGLRLDVPFHYYVAI